jgi:predicted nucleic acid-binding protein
MYLLDTNVISELRKVKLGKANHSVIAWADSVSAECLFLSAMTIFELELGILLLERRDPTQAAVLRSWLTSYVSPTFLERTLSIDIAIAQRCAKLHVPDPCADRDAMIAATALVHGMTLVTRNVDDFRTMGVKILNPWKFKH